MENRQKAKWSDITFSKSNPLAVLRQFESFFNDNFGGRDLLNEYYLTYKMDLLHTDPLPKKVIEGKNGWLFLGNSYVNTYDESLGLTRNSPEEIDAIALRIAQMKAVCDTNRIKFYFCVAPNKNSFYREFLPIEAMQGPRRIDLVKKKLKAKYQIDMVDLREGLEPYRNATTLFYKTDTHWNEYGAFLATKQLIDAIHHDFNNVPVKSIDRYQVDSTFELSHRDLAAMIGIAREDLRYQFTPRDSISMHIDTTGAIDGNRSYVTKTPTNKLKTIVYRDSFFTSMFNFFVPEFGTSSIYWTMSFDRDLVKEKKPDIVVFEVVERSLVWLK